MLYRGENENVSCKPRNETQLSFIFSLIIVLKNTTRVIGKRKKWTQIGDENVKLYLFTGDIAILLKDPKESTHTKILIDLLYTFISCKVQKLTFKNIVALYTNKELLEKEIF